MNSKEFDDFRKRLDKTQKQLAQLLGTSLKAVQSYNQGWRKVPGHIERQLLFLISRKGAGQERRSCWDIKQCPPDRRAACPAREFHSDDLCCFVNGTICMGKVHKNWEEKMKVCRNCEVLQDALAPT